MVPFNPTTVGLLESLHLSPFSEQFLVVSSSSEQMLLHRELLDVGHVWFENTWVGPVVDLLDCQPPEPPAESVYLVFRFIPLPDCLKVESNLSVETVFMFM